MNPEALEFQPNFPRLYPTLPSGNESACDSQDSQARLPLTYDKDGAEPLQRSPRTQPSLKMRPSSIEPASRSKVQTKSLLRRAHDALLPPPLPPISYSKRVHSTDDETRKPNAKKKVVIPPPGVVTRSRAKREHPPTTDDEVRLRKGSGNQGRKPFKSKKP